MARGISFRGTVLILVLSAILIFELRFSWVEVLVGRYLVATNHHRPESGTVWDQGHMRDVATQTLEQMVTQKLTVQREARQATSLVQLVDTLAASQGAMISAEQFKHLYTKMPPRLARNLFNPIFMLRISAERSWDRVYLEREADQVGIYLLDRRNNVLRHTAIRERQLKGPDTGHVAAGKTLDEMPEFAGRTYPADRFFMALDSLSQETQRGVLSQPDIFLGVDGVPVRVGVGDEVHSGLIRIGVEMDTVQGPQILSTMGQEWAVWQVRTLLDPWLTQPTVRRRGQPSHGGGR